MSRTSVSEITVRPMKMLGGELTVPGDKSLSHRALLLASLADGTSHLSGFLPGEDCVCTMRALQALGIEIEVDSPTDLTIHGTGGRLQASMEPLDCGNSGTAMRLLAGVLAGQNFRSRLVGDISLSGRPMGRIIDPLRRMGAELEGHGAKQTAPLEIVGRPLTGLTYTLPVASAQLKSCLLLAGLSASGTTKITEPTLTRDHTERLLAHFHAPPIIEPNPDGPGRTVQLRGGTKLHSRDFAVPGDFSSAAFWIVAAACLPQAELTVNQLGLNRTRTGLLGVLWRMGAHLTETIAGAESEPVGTLRVYGRKLHGTRIAGSEIANVIDELPILSVAAALAEGPTEIRDARELRVKETDRIAAMATNLREFGVVVEEHPDGMTIQGGAELRGAKVESFGDHRIAMACTILALFATGESIISDTDCIATSYPSFAKDLRKLVVFQEGGLASFFSGKT